MKGMKQQCAKAQSAKQQGMKHDMKMDMKPVVVAKQKIQAAINIHKGHMAKAGPPSKESEAREMSLLKGASDALNKMKMK